MVRELTPSEWTAIAIATAMTLGPLVPFAFA
jgi:hypothetical protein